MSRHEREEYYEVESTKTTHIRFVVDRIKDGRVAELVLAPLSDAHETARVCGELAVPLELLPPDVEERSTVMFSVDKTPDYSKFSGSVSNMGDSGGGGDNTPSEYP